MIDNDVFGPIPIPSLGKSMYYVSFIDDFSRNTWIYFLRNKSEVFDKFKEFKAMVENQTKKTRPISSLKRRPCCGIKGWGILEKRACEHYTVKVWLKVCIISLYILIYVKVAYMVNIIE